MALWHAKKGEPEDPVKVEIPDVPQSGSEEDGGPVEASDPLEQLSARLGQIGELLNQTNQQVLAYLSRRQSQTSAGAAAGAAAGLAEKIDGLSGKLDRLEASLKSRGQKASDGGAADPVAPGLAEFCNGINQQFAALADGIMQLQERIDAGLQGLAERLRLEPLDEPAPQPAIGPAIGLPVDPAGGDQWQRALLGTELAEYPGLDFQRGELLAGLLRGDAEACSLLGQLLIFRSAPTDKMPPLLKDIGEAYYRWQPKTRPGSSPMEKALVAWLKETMQEAGIANTIELVEPGERFDATRHTASTRGVEITEVRGWIVLREGGKVYTKASVAVR